MKKQEEVTFKIESGIPIQKKTRYGVSNYPWDKMKVGDSICVPIGDKHRGVLQSSLKTSARMWCNYNRKDWDFVTRLTDDKKSIRVWRTK